MADSYPGMEVRIIQKQAAIPSEGFVINAETLWQDVFENDGVFAKSHVEYMLNDFQRYLDAPIGVMLFHSGYLQGITNKSGTAPHPEMGGYGTGPDDRGIRLYYEWVRDHVAQLSSRRREYPAG